MDAQLTAFIVINVKIRKSSADINADDPGHRSLHLNHDKGLICLLIPCANSQQ
jgi:hypothetical protein